MTHWDQDAHPLINVLIPGGWDKSSGSESFRGPGKSAPNEGTREFPRVLDALASVCVSQTRHQVVAASVTLTKDGESVIVCIAQNDKGRSEVVAFLEKLWAELKTLWAQERYLRINSPHAVMSVDIENTMDRIYTLAYVHGRHKLRYRVSKRWAAFVEFQRAWSQSTSGPERLRTIIGQVFHAIRQVKALLDMPEMSSDELDYLVQLMRFLASECEHILEDRDQLRGWAEEAAPGAKSVFPLAQYLEKCVTLQHKLTTLCAFAFSYRLPVFDRKFLVNVVSVEPRRLSYPNSEESWRQYISVAFDTAGLVDTGQGITREAKTALKAQKTQTHAGAFVHSECVLLAYHHIQNHLSPTDAVTPPFGYIGNSKPSCYACAQYFSAYNADDGSPYYFSTRSADSKLYPRWAMPDLKDPGIEALVHDKFYENLCGDYGRYLAERGFARFWDGPESIIGSMHSIEKELLEAVYPDPAELSLSVHGFRP